MKAYKSSNSIDFEQGQSQSFQEEQQHAVKIKPYHTFFESFQAVLVKGDQVLIHLMLRQASHIKNKQLTRAMLKALISHASKSNG